MLYSQINSEVDYMKRIIYSTIVGIAIAGCLSVSVYAATNSLVGKKVQSVIAVIVNGQPIKDAIVIDGVTYAPLRSFSEAAGYSISFDKGGVNLSNQTEEEIIQTIQDIDKVETLKKNIIWWKSQLSGEKEAAELARKSIEKIDALNANSSAEAPKVDDAIAKEKLANAEAAIAELEAKITAAEAEIAELQAKIDANK